MGEGCTTVCVGSAFASASLRPRGELVEPRLVCTFIGRAPRFVPSISETGLRLIGGEQRTVGRNSEAYCAAAPPIGAMRLSPYCALRYYATASLGGRHLPAGRERPLNRRARRRSPPASSCVAAVPAGCRSTLPRSPRALRRAATDPRLRKRSR